jgi:multiple antibiotic resistance protein
MVGAGSVSVSILIGNAYGPQQWLMLLCAVLFINMISIILIKRTKDRFFTWRLKGQFKNILAVVFRLNSFFMGAVGIDMLLMAIKNSFWL